MALGNEERQKLINELAEIENDIQRVMNVDQVNELTNTDNLPATQLSLHDYTNELEDIQSKSQDIIDNLVKLYLGDNETLLNHEYIVHKRNKDADYFGKLDFLVNASQRTLINIMKEIDTGSSTPRMFEVLSLLQKEMRENIKLSSSNLTSIESFYKSMREDLGLKQEVQTVVEEVKEKEKEGIIVNHLNLNKQIDEWLKNREIEKDEKKD